MKRLWLVFPGVALVAALAFLAGQEAHEAKRLEPRRIAMVRLTAVDDATALGFKEAMSGLGYREGADIVYLSAEPAGEPDRLEAIIRGHLNANPDLFLVSSTPATQAVKRLTDPHGRPPVVFAPVNDPLGAGIVRELRHPGGHITGIRLPKGDDLRLQWLLRIAPGVKRVYLPYTTGDKSALVSLQLATEAAAKLGVKILPYPVSGDGGASAAVAALPADADAIFLPRDSRIEAGIDEFVAVAAKRRLPISAPSVTQVEAGALFSYGFGHRDIGRQAARLADQVFKGTSPGDLPVEMAENQLAINLVTARRIGIAIRDDIIVQAEYVKRE